MIAGDIGASRHLVIGLGEIGKALVNVLSRYYVKGVDVKDTLDERFDVIHICFPYSDKFIEFAEQYRQKYLADRGLIIIHSTLPIGTTEKIPDAVHSPVRGIHPYLEEGIKTFLKVFGGVRSDEAAQYFRELGITVSTTLNPQNTEAFKLWDTTIYGVNIVLEKEIYEYCTRHNLDFDCVYTLANTTYNQGYRTLGHPEYQKYVLKQVAGGIGGHCVVSNARLMGGEMAGLIIRKNQGYLTSTKGKVL